MPLFVDDIQCLPLPSSASLPLSPLSSGGLPLQQCLDRLQLALELVVGRLCPAASPGREARPMGTVPRPPPSSDGWQRLEEASDGPSGDTYMRRLSCTAPRDDLQSDLTRFMQLKLADRRADGRRQVDVRQHAQAAELVL